MTSCPEALIRSWDALLPQGTQPITNDPFALLSNEQLEDLAVYSRLQWLLRTARAEFDGLAAREASQLRDRLRAGGLDADALLAQRQHVIQQRIEHSNNQSVDRRRVRMPGVMVPCSLDGDGLIHEFLLLPHPMQCSPIPAPPPNQVVHAVPPEPLDVRQLFPAGPGAVPSRWVWLEGLIRFSVRLQELFLMDGFLSIESSYVVMPAEVQACSPDDLASLAEERAREQAMLLYPRLKDLILPEGGERSQVA